MTTQDAKSEELLALGRRFANWYMNAGEALAKHQPLSAALGLKPIVLDSDNGHTELEFTIGREYCNFLGGVHGGIVATLLDETACVVACARVGPGFRGTVSSRIDYLKPVAPGRILTKATLVRQTKHLMFIDASVQSHEGELLARSSCLIGFGQPANAQ
jgi:uncharacterized protein (TIGR00369 family)